MSSSYNYLPIPPRVWSRVQNLCTYDVSGSTYSSAYIPLTNQTVSQAQANYEDKLLYKGNILQYKGNSSRLSKKQKYSQLAKSLGPNRTKVFATQSQTYTNPNTTWLQRVNYATVPFPNAIVGQVNNISGPFQYDVPSPYGCSTTSVQEGGNLVCGTYVNPCTNQIIKTAPAAPLCFPSYCSDVPGIPIELCWNPKVQTWFPRQRYIMNNSGSKWPEGYKGFVSAVTPEAPVLTLDSTNCNSVTLSWSNLNNNCIPISSYNIYQNGVIIKTVSYTINSTIINGLSNNSSFYVTSISNTIESIPSNIVLFNKTNPFTATGEYSYTVDSNCNYIITFTGNGTIFFNNNSLVSYTVTGGGGNGANGVSGGGTYGCGGGGGGGGGGTNIGNFNTTLNSLYTITVGSSAQQTSISSTITGWIQIFGYAGSNGSSTGSTTGGDGGNGGTGTIPGNNGAKGNNGQSGGSGGAGGAGGSGYNGYGNGGKGGKGGDTNGGEGSNGNPGSSGVVIISFTN
jgi:hypothetical protein